MAGVDEQQGPTLCDAHRDVAAMQQLAATAASRLERFRDGEDPVHGPHHGLFDQFVVDYDEARACGFERVDDAPRVRNLLFAWGEGFLDDG